MSKATKKVIKYRSAYPQKPKKDTEIKLEIQAYFEETESHIPRECWRCEGRIIPGETFFLRQSTTVKDYSKYSRCSACIEALKEFTWVTIL